MTEKTKSPGRPPISGETMRQTGIRLPEYQIAWLKAQPEGVSEKIRELIDKAMKAEIPR